MKLIGTGESVLGSPAMTIEAAMRRAPATVHSGLPVSEARGGVRDQRKERRHRDAHPLRRPGDVERLDAFGGEIWR